MDNNARFCVASLRMSDNAHFISFVDMACLSLDNGMLYVDPGRMSPCKKDGRSPLLLTLANARKGVGCCSSRAMSL